jgi:hypothetical protein
MVKVMQTLPPAHKSTIDSIMNVASKEGLLDPPKKVCSNCNLEFPNQNPLGQKYNCAHCGLMSKKPKLVHPLHAVGAVQVEVYACLCQACI